LSSIIIEIQKIIFKYLGLRLKKCEHRCFLEINISEDFLSIQKELGVSKDEILYVGDTATDMQTAVGAGVKSIGVLWGFRDEKELSANKNISVSKLENSGNIVSNSKININGVLINTGELKTLDSITVSGDTTNNGSILTNKNFVTFNLINNKKLIAKEKIDIKNLMC